MWETVGLWFIVVFLGRFIVVNSLSFYYIIFIILVNFNKDEQHIYIRANQMLSDHRSWKRLLILHVVVNIIIWLVLYHLLIFFYFVAALPPSLNFLTITGELSEGEVLTASYGYIGGYEGKSQCRWYLHEVLRLQLHYTITYVCKPLMNSCLQLKLN